MWGAHAASGTKSPSAWGFEVLMEVCNHPSLACISFTLGITALSA